MSDHKIDPSPVLGGISQSVGDTELREVAGLSIVSISVPRGGDAALNQAMKKAYGAQFPDSGKSTISKDGTVRFLWMAPDQAFALFDNADDYGDMIVADRLGSTGYYTLQSDNWVVLRLSGGLAREALRRICQIDLEPDVFPEGSVARSVMEHMGAVVIAEGSDSFLLMSARSSAHSFFHAVLTSVGNGAQRA